MSPPPSRTVSPQLLDRIAAIVAEADAELAVRYPGDRDEVQPIHTAYVSAADVAPDTPANWGRRAHELLDRHAAHLAQRAGTEVVDRVRRRLAVGPVQDLRIDFEDGYGRRADAEEDAAAIAAGRALRAARLPWCGIRIKGLTGADLGRSLRTLELVLDAADGPPPGFLVTIPKFRSVRQVEAAVLLCEGLEAGWGLPPRTLRFELQIESPPAVLGADGAATLARALHLADRRCTGLHYGTYDYSAACGIASRFQSLEHPVADHAKAVMLVAAAQTGVWVCDGSTQVLPTGADADVVAALDRHHRLVTRSLERGYYQGWDMHPGHLVTRWLATFGFYREALRPAARRLQDYLDRRGGAVADEPATAEALARVLLRGLDCGAFEPAEVTAEAPDATVAELRNLKERKTG